MSLFKRLIKAAGTNMHAVTRQGEGFFDAPTVTSVATDAAMTMTVAQMAPGVIQYTGLTAGRVVTTPTAALILAACPDMDIGDSFTFWVSVTTAFAVTWAAGTGVTLAGRTTVVANTAQMVIVTKTAAATVTWTAL